MLRQKNRNVSLLRALRGSAVSIPRICHKRKFGLAKYKYKSDEKAIALMKLIAANNPEFHRGHSQLVEDHLRHTRMIAA